MRNFVIFWIDYISNIKWDLMFIYKKLTNSDFRNSINNNKIFKNKHKSKRCFIVGNGPSLNKLNLELLKDEFVLTVNNIMHDTTIYEKLNSDYHFLIDPLYFKLSLDNEQDQETIRLLKKINSPTKKPICFISYEGKSAFRNYGLSDELNLNYLYLHRNLMDKYNSEIDLSANMPTAQNIVHLAIYTAIYMGFSNIYLIGVDLTSVFLTYEYNDDGYVEISKNFHAYNYSESEVTTMLRDSKLHDNEFILYDYAKTFTIFKRIKRYANNKNVNIYNATKGGGLDVFPRVRYESLF